MPILIQRLSKITSQQVSSRAVKHPPDQREKDTLCCDRSFRRESVGSFARRADGVKNVIQLLRRG